MTAVAPLPEPMAEPTSSRSNTRWIVAGVGAVAAVAFAVWAKGRIDGLSLETQATNPIIRWEYVFVRPDTPGELRELAIEHLKLTVVPVVLGLIISSTLALIARWARWTLTPITVFAGFLYTIPSFALFAVLVSYTTNYTAAFTALTSYTLLILVRNIVAGLDGVPAHVLDAADGLGMSRTRRLVTVEIPLALPVIMTGIRVATVTTVGLVAVTSIIQLGGLGNLIFEGYDRQYTTLVTLGTGLSVLLAVVLDFALDRVGKLLTPWARRRAAR